MTKQLAFVLFNRNMFSATGKSDYPVINIDLTDKQVEILEEYEKKGLDILSIHESVNDRYLKMEAAIQQFRLLSQDKRTPPEISSFVKITLGSKDL